MNTIMIERLTLLAASLAYFCVPLRADEAFRQKADALIAKQDLAPLIQMCQEAVERGADAERAELCRTIIDHVKRGDVPPEVQGELLTMLVRFGGQESAEFLAGLLSHKDPLFRSRAVLGLQRNASEAAAVVLRKSLADAAQPEKRVEMTHALTLRGDRASLPEFLWDAASDDDAVRAAALLAVARLSEEPAKALFQAGINRGSAIARLEAIDTYLLHANRLATTGKKEEALAIYHELLNQGPAVKAAALLGMAQVGGSAELEAILKNLKGAEPSLIRITGKLFEPIPKSGPVIAAVGASVKTADRSLKIQLLGVLGRYADPAGVGAVLEAASDADSEVRIAAVRALGRFDDPRAVDTLVAALVAGKETAAALNAVETSPRKAGLADGLIAAWPSASGPVRVVLVQALRTCPASEALPSLLKGVEDVDGAVRSEAFVALWKIGDPSVYPRLVQRLADEADPNVQTAAVKALASLGARVKSHAERAAPVLERFAAGGGPGRPALLVLLARISCESNQEAGLKLVREALDGPDEPLRRAAIRALAQWPDPDPVLDILLQASQKERASTLGAVALGAYCQQVGALSQKRSVAVGEKKLSAEDAQKEVVRRCAQGLAAATQPAEVMGFLSLLGRQPHPDALKTVVGYVNDPRVKNEAIQAALNIASALYKTDPDAVRPVLEKIKAATEDKPMRARAEELLKAMEAKP